MFFAAAAVVGSVVLGAAMAFLKPAWLRLAYKRWAGGLVLGAVMFRLWALQTSAFVIGELNDRLSWEPDSALRASRTPIVRAQNQLEASRSPFVMLLAGSGFIWMLGWWREQSTTQEPAVTENAA